MNETLGRFTSSARSSSPTVRLLHDAPVAGPRRPDAPHTADPYAYETYAHLQPMNQFISFCAFALLGWQIFFVINFFARSMAFGQARAAQPRGAASLEWEAPVAPGTRQLRPRARRAPRPVRVRGTERGEGLHRRRPTPPRRPLPPDRRMASTFDNRFRRCCPPRGGLALAPSLRAGDRVVRGAAGPVRRLGDDHRGRHGGRGLARGGGALPPVLPDRVLVPRHRDLRRAHAPVVRRAGRPVRDRDPVRHGARRPAAWRPASWQRPRSSPFASRARSEGSGCWKTTRSWPSFTAPSAQAVVALLISCAVYLSPRWRMTRPAATARSTPGLRLLAGVTVLLVFGQVVLGAWYRHALRPAPSAESGGPFLLHALGAAVVRDALRGPARGGSQPRRPHR